MALTKAQREAAQLEEIKLALAAAVQEAVAPLTERICALEAALDGARNAYRDLRAKVEATPAEAPGRPQVNLWNKACRSLREEQGLAPTAWLPRGDIERRMAELESEAA